MKKRRRSSVVLPSLALPFVFAVLAAPVPAAWAGENIVWSGDQGALARVNGADHSLAPGGSSGEIGQSTSDSLSGNSVSVIGGIIGGSVFGAVDSKPDHSVVTNNDVIIKGGQVDGSVYGAYNYQGDAVGNRVTVKGGQVGGDVIGGYSTIGAVTGNSVIISDGVVDGGDVMGGYSNGPGGVTGNSVTISGGWIQTNVLGGFNTSTDATAYNSVVILGGTVDGFVFGATSFNGVVTNNSVVMTGGYVRASVIGGRSIGGLITGNSVAISGGRVDGDVIGGYNGASGGATSNSVSYSGGSIGGNLFGGHKDSGADDIFTGNRLNVLGMDLAAGGDLGHFQYLNFLLPGAVSVNATMLTVAGGADLTDGLGGSSSVSVGIVGGGPVLRVGDQVALIRTGAGLTANNAALNHAAIGKQGFSLNYTFDIWADSDTLWATILTAPTINPQTKALPEGRMAGLAFVNQGADLIGSQGFDAAMIASDSKRWTTFAAMSGGSSRYDTGSHVDLDGASIMAGLGGRPDLDQNALFLGAFLEAGRGNYDSRNSFANAASIKGDGDTNYYGAGLMARYDVTAGNLAGLYGQGAIRAGRSKTDFSSADLIAADGQRARYDSAAAYYGAQAGLGYVFALTGATSLDLSSAYLWTHQNSDSVTASSNDPIHFDAMDSQRWRNGGRLRHTLDSASGSVFTPYVGAYHDYEFDGKANATAYGYAIDAPSLKGSTGIGEAGFGFKPAADSPLSLDLGVQGYVGVREGVSGRLQAKIAL